MGYGFQPFIDCGHDFCYDWEQEKVKRIAITYQSKK
tara:strand:+ start:133 stop:240 length:108 start_codon:yes stop_codon:yes gene_type:complete